MATSTFPSNWCFFPCFKDLKGYCNLINFFIDCILPILITISIINYFCTHHRGRYFNTIFVCFSLCSLIQAKMILSLLLTKYGTQYVKSDFITMPNSIFSYFNGICFFQKYKENPLLSPIFPQDSKFPSLCCFPQSTSTISGHNILIFHLYSSGINRMVNY